MSIIAMASLLPLRVYMEDRSMLAAEMTLISLITIVGAAFRQDSRCGRLSGWLIPFVPIFFAVVGRRFATPVPMETVALTVFGAVAIAVASGTRSRRMQGISLIISGFLVLFCTPISPSQYAIFHAVAWMLVCVWHLIANHWERLDLAMPESVSRTWTLRPTTTIATALLLAVGGYAAKDRFVASEKLTFGVMPTSGGSRWYDPAALSGVGDGDKAVAAKDHAESFGAVDSDILLESAELSLFDVLNNLIGEPLKKKNNNQIVERRQALANQDVIPMHEQVAKSEQGGQSFATERMPPKKHRNLKDSVEASVIQWDGPTGIRLAMHRYDTFAEGDWTQSDDLSREKLSQVVINEASWFFDPKIRNVLLRDPDATSVGLLKVIRLNSPRLPVPMMTAGIHVKDVDRPDFFGLDTDGSFHMLGRKKVPPLTVVHVASVHLMEDTIRSHLQLDPSSETVKEEGESSLADTASDPFSGSDVNGALAACVQKWTSKSSSAYDQLETLVDHLRTDFTFAREGETSATSLDEFLHSRRGGDHLFATTAALMARQLGLSSRLVTGFYVRPDAFELVAGHACVLPRDVHVWAEIQLDDGRWFEIEPTPGYQQPYYRPSWRLLACRFAGAHWRSLTGTPTAAVGIYLLRRFWIDWLLTILWNLTGWLRLHHRVRLAVGIIETRARLAGQRRPVGKTQRAWLEQLTRSDAKIAKSAREFSDVADALFFGSGPKSLEQDATDLVDLLGVRTISQLTKEAMS